MEGTYLCEFQNLLNPRDINHLLIVNTDELNYFGDNELLVAEGAENLQSFCAELPHRKLLNLSVVSTDEHLS